MSDSIKSESENPKYNSFYRDELGNLVYDPKGELEPYPHSYRNFIIARTVWFYLGMSAGAASGHNVLIVGTLFTTATLLWTIFHIFTHELSHAIAARLLGSVVTQVAIGRGKSFAKIHFLGLPIVFYDYLTQGGMTFIDESKLEGYIQRRLITISAGPLSDIILLFLLIPFCGDGYNIMNLLNFNDGPEYIACAFGLIQLSSLIHNLFPWQGTKTVAIDGIVSTSTDGHQIFDILLLKDKRREQNGLVENQRAVLESYNTGENIPDIPLSGKPQFAYAQYRFHALVQKNEVDYAEAVMEWMIQKPNILRAEKILYLDALASHISSSSEGFIHRKRALDVWIEKALEIQGGDSITLLVTKGILLVLNDRYQEGERILSKYATDSKIQHDRYGSCLFMAVSRSWQGDFENAKTWLEKARNERTNQEAYDAALHFMRKPPKDDGVERAVFEGSTLLGNE